MLLFVCVDCVVLGLCILCCFWFVYAVLFLVCVFCVVFCLCILCCFLFVYSVLFLVYVFCVVFSLFILFFFLVYAQLKDRRSKDLMLMLGLNETIHQVFMANSVHCVVMF